MKWLSFLSKPAWESADPVKRAAAVASEAHPDLLGKIPDLARHDSDPDVRKAAVRRVDDLSLLSDRGRLDPSAEVREAARLRLRHFMLDAKTPFEQRQRQALATDDHELLEALAVQSVETDMRRAALERIQRTGFLLERCLKDSDPQLRIELLDRIEDPAALERIAEGARKSDKRLSRLARDRLSAARLRNGDPTAIRARAEAICSALEAFLRQRPLDLTKRMADLASDWQQLAPAPDEAMARRYQGLVDTLRHMLEVAARPDEPAAPAMAEPIAAIAELEAGTEFASAGVDQEDPDLRALVEAFEQSAGMSAAALEEMQQRFRSLFARAAPGEANRTLQARHEQHLQQLRSALLEQNRQQEQARRAAQTALADYSHALDAGRLSEARAARQRAHALEAGLPAADRDGKRLEHCDAEFDKLQRWQRWSNDSQRKRLCDEIEASMGSGEHPDALLTRIKSAQAEWQRLDESEREPGQAEAPASGLGKRFRVLCSKAIAPARPYLEKRSALRSQKRDEVSQLIEEVEQTLANSALSFDAQALRKRVIEGLRQLDEVPPQERRKLSERLRAAKESLDNRINQSRADAEADKRKFISQLRRRLGQGESADAINAAKDAMARWKTLPRGDRKVEDQLWAELRAVVDPVFEKSKLERGEQEAAQGAERSAIAEVLAEAGALAGSEHEAHALETRMAALQQRWRALANRGRDDEREFDRLLDAIRHAQRGKLADSARRSRGEAQRLRAALIASAAETDPAEVQTALRAEISAAALAAADRAALGAHLAALQASNTVDIDEALAELEWDAVLAELLAGIDSPADAQALRKQVQMHRLAEKLGGAASGVVSEEAAALWLRWLTHSGLAPAERISLDARIALALDRLLDQA